ncbi:MAG: precorrin-3B C(17)-methyltransferase, partial [Fenollaria timonensis]
MNKLYVVGIGPGSKENMTFKAVDVIKEADTIVAYTKYLAYVEDFIDGKEIIKTGMTGEKERCQLAIDEYNKGKTVAIISTGDSGLYGMAGLVYEIDPSINIEVVPGVSAAFSSASVVGAPLM